MEFLTQLWLPIVLSAVAVFFASFVAWMVLPHHKPDFSDVPDKDGLLASLRATGLGPGVYMFPCGDPADMKTEEGQKRFREGPWGVLMLHAGPPNFGRNLGTVALFYLVVSVLVAYVTRSARAPGADFGSVMQIAATCGVMAYALGGIPHGIFFGRTLRSMAMDLLDSVIFGLLTGLIFAWLWPSAGAALPG